MNETIPAAVAAVHFINRLREADVWCDPPTLAAHLDLFDELEQLHENRAVTTGDTLTRRSAITSTLHTIARQELPARWVEALIGKASDESATNGRKQRLDILQPLLIQPQLPAAALDEFVAAHSQMVAGFTAYALLERRSHELSDRSVDLLADIFFRPDPYASHDTDRAAERRQRIRSVVDAIVASGRPLSGIVSRLSGLDHIAAVASHPDLSTSDIRALWEPVNAEVNRIGAQTLRARQQAVRVLHTLSGHRNCPIDLLLSVDTAQSEPGDDKWLCAKIAEQLGDIDADAYDIMCALARQWDSSIAELADVARRANTTPT